MNCSSARYLDVLKNLKAKFDSWQNAILEPISAKFGRLIVWKILRTLTKFIEVVVMRSFTCNINLNEGMCDF